MSIRRKILTTVAVVGAALTLGYYAIHKPDVEVNRGRYATEIIDNRKVPISDDRWIGAKIYRDSNGNGTLDTFVTITCKTRPNSFGLDSDCNYDELALLNNSYPGGYGAGRVGGFYSQLGKYTDEGRRLQNEFEALLKQHRNRLMLCL